MANCAVDSAVCLNRKINHMIVFIVTVRPAGQTGSFISVPHPSYIISSMGNAFAFMITTSDSDNLGIM